MVRCTELNEKRLTSVAVGREIRNLISSRSVVGNCGYCVVYLE